MTREQWARLKQIFGDALELESARREEYVRDAAAGDPELVTELLRLLEESDRESKLLSRPALAGARPFERDEPLRFASDTVLARRFRVVRFIARGGMGEVYEAEDLELGERVALKAIRRRIAPDSELLALFKKEVQLARRVTHPNVCRIFDLAQHEDSENGATMLLSMELLDGVTLSEHLRHSGPLNSHDALPLIEEIAAGLQAVHDAGIIHGDLKPGNVMLVSREGELSKRAVVMDFGMALPVASSGQNVSRGGTPEYFAPEQSSGKPVSTATDVYSLALMISEMLGVPRPERLKPDAERMPSRWARVLQRCLEGDPARRLARPADLAGALRRSAGYRRRTLLWIGAAGLASLVAISGAVILLGRPTPVTGEASRLLLTEGSSIMVHRPSPDGRYVVATAWDTQDLVLLDVARGKSRRITQSGRPGLEGSSTGGARFSPDGKRIAYEWWIGAESDLRLIGTDGTGERILYRHEGTHPSALDWSPDGSRLLVRLTSGVEQRIAIVSTSTGSVTFPAVPPANHLSDPIFSASGDGLVFTVPKNANAGSEIHALSADGVESTLITSASNADSILGWSPDRSRLIFSSDRRGQKSIWAVAVSAAGVEGEPQELIPDSSKWQVLGITQTGSLLYRLEGSAVDVFTAVLDLDANRTVSPPTRVMDRFIGWYATPNWSEDGRRLVAVSKHDPRQSALLIYEPSRRDGRELKLDLREVGRPQWVEHGRAIMVLGTSPDGISGQFRIDPDTGVAKLFMSAEDLQSGLEGVWSADGKFQFNRFQDERRGIFRLNTETGQRQVLYAPPPGVDVRLENLALSPDGRTLAFHARNNAEHSAALMLVSPEGGEARPLLTIQQPEAFIFGSFAWTPDSKRILAARTRGNVSELWVVPVDGGAPAKIDFPAGLVACLRLNPDGRTIAFHRGVDRSEIWMLQKFL